MAKTFSGKDWEFFPAATALPVEFIVSLDGTRAVRRSEVVRLVVSPMVVGGRWALEAEMRDVTQSTQLAQAATEDEAKRLLADAVMGRPLESDARREERRKEEERAHEKLLEMLRPDSVRPYFTDAPATPTPRQDGGSPPAPAKAPPEGEKGGHKRREALRYPAGGEVVEAAEAGGAFAVVDSPLPDDARADALFTRAILGNDSSRLCAMCGKSLAEPVGAACVRFGEKNYHRACVDRADAPPAPDDGPEPIIAPRAD